MTEHTGDDSNRQYRVFVAMNISSGFATGVLPVVMAFAVLRVTGSSGDLGLVLALQAVASLSLTLFGGVAGDRYALKRVLMCGAVLRVVCSLAPIVLILVGQLHVWEIALDAVGFGGADSFYAPALGALATRVVEPDMLRKANATTASSASMAALIAPSVAGILVGLGGPGLGFALDGLAMVTTCSLLSLLDVSSSTLVVRTGSEGILREIRDGWTEFRSRSWLAALTAQWSIYALAALGPVTVLGPVIAERRLGGALAWGLISTSAGVGVILGSLTSRRFRFHHPLRALAIVGVMLSAESLSLGLDAPIFVVLLCGVVSGLVAGLISVTTQTLLQQAIPSSALVRVSAFDLLGSEVTLPLGYAVAGLVGGGSRAGVFLFIGGCLVSFGSVASLSVREVRNFKSGYP